LCKMVALVSKLNNDKKIYHQLGKNKIKINHLTKKDSVEKIDVKYKDYIPYLDCEPYMTEAFCQFSLVLESYINAQNKAKHWKFGQVLIPTILYRINDGNDGNEIPK